MLNSFWRFCCLEDCERKAKWAHLWGKETLRAFFCREHMYVGVMMGMCSCCTCHWPCTNCCKSRGCLLHEGAPSEMEKCCEVQPSPLHCCAWWQSAAHRALLSGASWGAIKLTSGCSRKAFSISPPILLLLGVPLVPGWAFHHQEWLDNNVHQVRRFFHGIPVIYNKTVTRNILPIASCLLQSLSSTLHDHWVLLSLAMVSCSTFIWGSSLLFKSVSIISFTTWLLVLENNSEKNWDKKYDNLSLYVYLCAYT